MYINQKVQELFSSRTVMFHDKKGVPVPREQLVAEYRAIKNFLLNTRSEGDIVAIQLDYDYLYLVCIYACMEVGLTYLPLNIDWPQQRVDQIKALSNFAFLIETNNINNIVAYREEPTREPFSLLPTTPLYIIYTSGTTGEPKGVVIERQAYENFVKWMDADFELTNDSAILLVADFTFDMSLLDIALLLSKKCKIFFSQFNANLFVLAYEIENYKINSIATVPNNINMLLREGVFERTNLSSLKFLLLGGSRFSYGAYKNIFEKLKNPGMKCYNFYGPTEATVYSHYKLLSGNESDDVLDSNVSVGKPATNVSSILVDEDDEPIISSGVPGELLIGGVQVMAEYFNNPEKTAQSLVYLDGVKYYRTGDLAFMDERQEYRIVGRKDETLKRRGYRINLLDIDSYLQKIDAVQECRTIAVPDPDAEHILVSFIAVNREVTVENLKKNMKDHLVDYQIPDRIEFVNSFPLNNSGKICRKTLEKIYKEQVGKA